MGSMPGMGFGSCLYFIGFHFVTIPYNLAVFLVSINNPFS